MARLFSDEDFSLRVVNELRRLGHDVLTVRELGLANRKTADPVLLTIATRDDRAMLTYNRRDFGRLHLANARHAGIIDCTGDPDVARQAQRIQNAISAHDSLAGQFISVTRPGPNEESA